MVARIFAYTGVLTLLAVAAACGLLALLYWLHGEQLIGKQKLLEFGVIVASILAPIFLTPLVYLTLKLRALSGKFHHLARSDPLTKIPNRLAFFEHAEGRFANRVDTTTFSLLMIDVDHFKQVNDRFGHETGDAALVLIARTIVSVTAHLCPAGALVARIGGEEFAVLLEGEAARVAKRLAAALCRATRLAQFRCRDAEVPLSISVGVCCDAKGRDAGAALAMADEAAYAAKAGGRGRWIDTGALKSRDKSQRRAA